MKKRIVSGLTTVACMLMTAVSVSAAPADVDQNGAFNMIDASCIYAYAAGHSVWSMEQFCAADVNFDRKVNMIDALAVYQAASGGINSLPQSAVYSVEADSVTGTKSGIEISVAEFDLYPTITISYSVPGSEIMGVTYDENAIYISWYEPKTGGTAADDCRYRRHIGFGSGAIGEREVRLIKYTDTSETIIPIEYEILAVREEDEESPDVVQHRAVILRCVEDLQAAIDSGFACEAYTEAFFKKKALVMIHAYETSFPMDFTLGALERRGTTLEMQTHVDLGTGLDACAQRYCLLAVDAAAVEGVENVTLVRTAYSTPYYELL